MKSLLLLLGLSLGLAALPAGASDTRLFEMRTYYAASGKTDALLARFRDHTLKLFARHGMENIGYWVPLDEKDGTNRLVYVLAYPNRSAREQAWKDFSADPEWQTVARESEKGGRLVEKVEQRFLTATDYSPAIAPAVKSPRVFELRTYTATPGKLGDLNARFRDHTVKLFANHGIVSVAYWTPETGQPGADDTLVYLVAHPSRAAAAEAFKAFGADPAWQAARKASEEKAGGSLTVKDGVKSVFLQATDFSPTR